MKLFLLLIFLVPTFIFGQRRTSTSFETANVFDSITFVESCCGYSFIKNTFWKYKGNNSIRVEGRKDDDPVVTGGKRQELNFNSNPDTTARYLIEWFRWSNMFPDSLQFNLIGKDFIIHQFKQPGVGGVQTGGSPPLAMLVDSNKYRLDIRWATAANPNNNENSNRRLIYVGDIVKGQTDHFVIRYRWSSLTTGMIHLWRNGVLVVSDTGRNYYEGAGRPSVKVGMYHYRWSEPSYGNSISDYRVMYIDDIGVFGSSSTYEDVATFILPPTPDTPVVSVPNYTTTGTTLTLVSSVVSDDPITDYTWTFLSGPNTPSVSVPVVGSLELSGLIDGTYNYRLIVTDNEGQTGTAYTTITKYSSSPNNYIKVKGKIKIISN